MEQLTQAEANKQVQEKANQIESLAKALKVGMTAVQSVQLNGVISNVIIYTDLERYQITQEQKLPLVDVKKGTPTPDVAKEVEPVEPVEPKEVEPVKEASSKEKKNA